jgi:hypothetical protein
MDSLWIAGGIGFVSIFIPIIFVIVIGSFIFMAVKGISTWSKNNQSPVLTVTAEVVVKLL